MMKKILKQIRREWYSVDLNVNCSVFKLRILTPTLKHKLIKQTTCAGGGVCVCQAENSTPSFSSIKRNFCHE